MALANSLRGRVILVTGAGSGIGRATSIKLARLGASLVLSDINRETISGTKMRCECVSDEAQTHTTLTCDVSSNTEVDDMVEQAIHQHKALHHVYNCAGVNPTPTSIEATPDAYFTKLFDVNLRGTFNVSRACLSHLDAGSSIVNVSSMAGIRPSAGLGVYAATKAAVIALSKSLALEVGPRDLRVNVIAPGDVETTTNAAVNEGEDAVRQSRDRIALGRFGTPDEIAEVAAFLFSDASRYVNGTVIEVNGGLR